MPSYSFREKTFEEPYVVEVPNYKIQITKILKFEIKIILINFRLTSQSHCGNNINDCFEMQKIGEGFRLPRPTCQTRVVAGG